MIRAAAGDTYAVTSYNAADLTVTLGENLTADLSDVRGDYAVIHTPTAALGIMTFHQRI